jgi:signal peptidase II
LSTQERHPSARRSLSTGAIRFIWVPALAACGVVVAIDQGTKALARTLVDRGDRVEVLPFLAFHNVRNEGVAFGLGGDIPAAAIGATILVLLCLLVFLAARSRTGWLIWLPAALLIGGALGNLSDRVRDGAVTDFIDLPLWPTFNLADVSIVVGVLLLLFDIERGDRGGSSQREPPGAGGTGE